MIERQGGTRRQRQARREVGHTEVARPVALALVLLTALAIVTPPLAQVGIDLGAGRGPLPAFEPLSRAARRALAGGGDPLAANRDLLAGLTATETRLEDESWLRTRLLPPAQWLLTGVLGLGNEQVVAGDRGWWHFASDFGYATGRGFLEPETLARREIDEGVAADPVAAILELAATLERHGVDLLVVPVPAKSSIVPSTLAPGVVPPVHNPSFSLFVDRLAAAEVELYDPAADLLALEESGSTSFLRTDTHWTPSGLDRTATAIASRLDGLVVDSAPDAYYRRRVVVSGRGDLVAMLSLPEGSRLIAPEEVETEVVLTARGEAWSPTVEAQVLLLGDSFTNVYSDAGLGWGRGAGLAEQLSYRLGAPVDRIARNAGGAYSSRAELAADPDRLRGKRVVVYQFAARELVEGDWGLVFGSPQESSLPDRSARP